MGAGQRGDIRTEVVSRDAVLDHLSLLLARQMLELTELVPLAHRYRLRPTFVLW